MLTISETEKKEESVWEGRDKTHCTSNDRNTHVSVAIDKDVDGILERLVIQQQRCYVLEHNPCLPNKHKKVAQTNEIPTQNKEAKQKKKKEKTLFWEVRNHPNGIRYGLKPWVSFQSVLRCKHSFFLPLTLFFFFFVFPFLPLLSFSSMAQTQTLFITRISAQKRFILGSPSVSLPLC